MRNMFEKLRKKRMRKKVAEAVIKNTDGKTVLSKTEDFLLYIMKNKDDAIIGTILLSETQANILNDECSEYGIRFVRTV